MPFAHEYNKWTMSHRVVVSLISDDEPLGSHGAVKLGVLAVHDSRSSIINGLFIYILKSGDDQCQSCTFSFKSVMTWP